MVCASYARVCKVWFNKLANSSLRPKPHKLATQMQHYLIWRSYLHTIAELYWRAFNIRQWYGSTTCWILQKWYKNSDNNLQVQQRAQGPGGWMVSEHFLNLLPSPSCWLCSVAVIEMHVHFSSSYLRRSFWCELFSSLSLRGPPSLYGLLHP